MKDVLRASDSIGHRVRVHPDGAPMGPGHCVVGTVIVVKRSSPAGVVRLIVQPDGGGPEVSARFLAADVLDEVDGKNQAAVALGRLGASKGGLARAAKLTPQQRTEIARKAARARWEKSN